MSSIYNHNFSIYFTLPALKKRVLIISFHWKEEVGIMKKLALIVASIVVLYFFAMAGVASAENLNEQEPAAGFMVAQLRQTRPMLSPAPLPTRIQRTLVIVVEENQAQTYSVSWGGLSTAMQRIDPVNLLPAALQNSIRQVAAVVDPMIRALNIPQTHNLMEVVRLDLRRQFAKMLADWLVNAGNLAGIPGTGCAREIITTVASQGVQLGKDPFAVFKDRYGEVGLGNCLRQMAMPYYDRVYLLTDQSATFLSFSNLLKRLDNAGYEIDVLLDIHGCDTTTSLNNKTTRYGPYLVFAPEPGNPDSAYVSPSKIATIKAGGKLRLRNVYMVSCWGSKFNSSWRTAGAKESNGARELNYYILMSPLSFLDAYTRGGRSLRDAANVAYNAERNIFNGGSYPITIDLKAFFDSKFPHRSVGLLPCAGLNIQGIQIGMSLRTDYVGRKDYCVGSTLGQTYKVDTGCPPLHRKQIRTRTDRCWPPDVIGAACPGGTRNGCRFRFDLGLAYGPIADQLLALKYGKNTMAPVNNRASSSRIHNP